MADNQSGCQEKSFFGENSYVNTEPLKSQKSLKDSSNAEKEFNW